MITKTTTIIHNDDDDDDVGKDIKNDSINSNGSTGSNTVISCTSDPPDDNKDDDDTVVLLSDHTFAMRRALLDCRRRCAYLNYQATAHVAQQQQPAQQHHHYHECSFQQQHQRWNVDGVQHAARRRQQCQRRQCHTTSPPPTTTEGGALSGGRIDVVTNLSSSSSNSSSSSSSSSSDEVSSTTISNFRCRYIQGNRPCLIRDPSYLQQYFSTVQNLWTTTTTTTTTSSTAPPQQRNHQEDNDEDNNKHDDYDDDPTITEPNRVMIRRNWFVQTMGADTLVPVRCCCNSVGGVVSSLSSSVVVSSHQQQQHPQPQEVQQQQLLLDPEGRAVECPVETMTLQHYLDWMDDHHQHQSSATQRRRVAKSSSPMYYLKDWHFQMWFEQQQQQNAMTTNTTENYSENHTNHNLYTVPSCFPHDLLNAFLLKYYSDSDYRFVYWGPSGSTTDIHSDVLHSYSWSYNACGIKEWTFYIDIDADHHNDDVDDDNDLTNEKDEQEATIPKNGGHTTMETGTGSPVHSSNNTNNKNKYRAIVVRQNTGEMIFVPSKLRHSVINITETLSINHNWITTYNLRVVWEDCIMTELQAVNTELELSWNIIDPEARENMLRGCIGLDVTSFFFMVLTRGLELWSTTSSSSSSLSLVLSWQDSFDITCLVDTLNMILFWDKHIDNDDNNIDSTKTSTTATTRQKIHLKDRLTATLADAALAEEAIQIANNFVTQVYDDAPSTRSIILDESAVG